MRRQSTNVFRWSSKPEPQRCRSGKSHLSGGLLSHWPGMACRKVRETRHLVTRHGGSWFQTVGGELCRRGQRGVCILSWGRRDSLWQIQALFSYGGKESWGRVNVWTWRRVKLYCPDVFIHSTTAEKGPFYSVRNLTWCLHTCVQQLLVCGMFPCAHFSARLCISFCDSIVIPHRLLLVGDRKARRFPAHAGSVVTHGNRWVTLPPAATANKLNDHELCELKCLEQGRVIIGSASHGILGIVLFIYSD